MNHVLCILIDILDFKDELIFSRTEELETCWMHHIIRNNLVQQAIESPVV